MQRRGKVYRQPIFSIVRVRLVPQNANCVLTESEKDTAARTALRNSSGSKCARERRSTLRGLEAVARNASGMLLYQLRSKTAPATDWNYGIRRRSAVRR